MKEAYKIPAGHVGSPGERLDLRLKLVDVHVTNSDFGPMFIHKFVDEEGTRFTWLTCTTHGSVDGWYTVRGTVKRHGEYNGIKETYLTRCKLLA